MRHDSLMNQFRSIIGPLALATFVIVAICIPYLGTLPLWQEEPRRALIAETMIQTGDFVVPRYMEDIYLAKPPLYNWVVVGVTTLFGEMNEFSLRFGSVLCLLFLVFSMLSIHKSWLSKKGLYFLALALALSPEFISKATLAEIDMCFALLVNLSLWLWFANDRKGVRGISLWLIPAIIVGLAFLTKREPAFVFYYVGIGAYLLYKRRVIELFQPAHLICAFITLIVVGFWLWEIWKAVGSDALLVSSVNEVIHRSLIGSFQTILLHMLSYPFEVCLAIFPFCLLLGTLLHTKTRAEVIKNYDDIFAFAVIVVLSNFCVYWLIPASAVRYFLPMMPSMLVICAILFEIAPSIAPRWIQNISLGLCFFSLLLAVALNIFLHRGTFGFGGSPPHVLPAPMPLILAMCAVIVAVLSLWLNTKAQHLLIASCCVIFVYRIIFFDILLPRKVEKFEREADVATFVEKIYQTVPKEGFPVSADRSIPHELWWYLDFGDISLAPSNYIITEKQPDTTLLKLAEMNFEGRKIFLVNKD